MFKKKPLKNYEIININYKYNCIYFGFNLNDIKQLRE